MTDRYGNTSMATVLRDWNALRDAIRAHDTEATEAEFEKVERWAGLWTTGQAFTADDLRRAFAIAIEMAETACLPGTTSWPSRATDYAWAASDAARRLRNNIRALTPPYDLAARVKEGRDG